MAHDFVIADVNRAGDHLLIVGALIVIAAVGGLVYGLVRLVGRRRASRTPSDCGPDA